MLAVLQGFNLNTKCSLPHLMSLKKTDFDEFTSKGFKKASQADGSKPCFKATERMPLSIDLAVHSGLYPRTKNEGQGHMLRGLLLLDCQGKARAEKRRT